MQLYIIIILLQIQLFDLSTKEQVRLYVNNNEGHFQVGFFPIQTAEHERRRGFSKLMTVSVRGVFQSLIIQKKKKKKVLNPVFITANFPWLIHRAGLKNSPCSPLYGSG